MAEYIDRQKLIDDFHTAGSCFVYGDYIPAIVSRIKTQPTIEPEAMPVVQELQAQVKEQKEQLAHLEYWGLDRKIVLESAAQDRAAVNVMRKHCEKTIAELRAELKRVTAERDAAMKYRAELADYLLATCGKYCFGDHDTVPCSWRDSNGICKLREWEEAVAENATAESKPKPQWKELAVLQPLDGVESKERAGKNHVPGYPPQKVYCADCKNPNNPEKCLLAGQEKPISIFCSGFEPKENANG